MDKETAVRYAELSLKSRPSWIHRFLKTYTWHHWVREAEDSTRRVSQQLEHADLGIEEYARMRMLHDKLLKALNIQ